MSFDSAIGVLALSVGFAAVVLGLVAQTTPHRHKWMAAIFAACGTALVAFTPYFLLGHLSHRKQMEHIEEVVLKVLEPRSLTIDQIRDAVNLIDNNTTNREILEAVEDLKYKVLLHRNYVHWQDVNANQYYSTVYS